LGGRGGQILVPLTEIGRWTPPIPCLPAAAEPPRCGIVTLAPGVPAVRFGLTFAVELDVPPDALALGLPPERVPALGLAFVFVLVDTGTFFDGFVLTVTPDRGAEPFARAFGAVVVAPDLALGCVRWPAATAAVGIARATTSPTMIMTFFMSVSPLTTCMGNLTFKVSTARRLTPR